MDASVRIGADDAEGRRQLARDMIRCPFSLEKMSYRAESGVVIYRSKLHARFKRNFQLMPGAEWLKLLIRHIPDKGEHLARYCGWYSNRCRGMRRLAGQEAEAEEAAIGIEEGEVDPDFRRSARAGWARLIRKVYEVDPLACPHCGGEMRCLAVIEEGPVIERIQTTPPAFPECPGDAIPGVPARRDQGPLDLGLAPTRPAPRRGLGPAAAASGTAARRRLARGRADTADV